MPDTEDVYRRIGNRLRQLRETRGLSQEALALEADLNRAYVGYIERAERRASVLTLARLAHALGVELADLFQFDR